MEPELAACASRSEGQRHTGGGRGQVKARFSEYAGALRVELKLQYSLKNNNLKK